MEKETAQKAATWWANHLRSPARLDNGDESETGVMTFMLGTMRQDSMRKEITEEQIQSFEDNLKSLLEEETRDYVCFGVDYHPDMILDEAASRAGINVDGVLPWKTNMWIDKDKVEVSLGYRSPVEEI